jgi:hypothetical protein
MERLQSQLNEMLSRLKNEADVKARLETLVSVYPFNEFEYIISTLLGAGVLSLGGYYELRKEYTTRNENLEVFQITAPTAFGITWAQAHVQELVPEMQKPSKGLDGAYSGEYDFFLEPSIRIEVKASRAVAYRTKGPLYSKALASNSNKQFDMNFQQLKPDCCDVFVWIAVWIDVIRYWVLASREVESHPDYSPQHRGGEESQLHIKRENLAGFQKYEVRSSELLEAIRNAHQRQFRKAQ